MDEETVGIIVGCVVGLVLIAGLLITFKWGEIQFFDNIPSKVWVDDKLVYEGSSAGFDIHSSGFATTVTLQGGFLYAFPKAVYTSKNVRVEGSK